MADTGAARILHVLRRGPVHVILIAIGLLWLVPTLGLFLTSLLPAAKANEGAGGRSSPSPAS